MRLLTRLVLLLLLATPPAWADPALWVVRGPRATVYLLGSVHMLRPGTEWQGAAIRRAFDAAEECWFEIALPDNPAALQGTVLQRGFDFGHDLSDRLTPETRAKLHDATGGGEAMVSHMRPWFAALFVALEPLQRAGFDPALGVDTVLQDQAKAASKPIRGIETADAQVRLLSDLPDDLALKLLDSSLDDAAKGPAFLEGVIAHWLAGDADGAGAAATADLHDKAPELFQRIFTDRNRLFADAVARLAAGDKTVLVTVGAGHLAGPEGVPALLAKQSVKAERVTE